MFGIQTADGTSTKTVSASIKMRCAHRYTIIMADDNDIVHSVELEYYYTIHDAIFYTLRTTRVVPRDTTGGGVFALGTDKRPRI